MRLLASVCITLCMTGSAFGQLTFTDPAAFNAAILGGSISVLNFNSLAAGTVIADNTTQGGITFGYTFPDADPDDPDDLDLAVTNAFATTSLANSLSTDNGLIPTGPDFSISLSFGAVNALGLYFITPDTTPLADDEITVNFGSSGSVSLQGAVFTTLGSGADTVRVYFLGFVDAGNTFSGAGISTSNGASFYGIDDITTATITVTPVPEPSSIALLALGGGLLGWRFRRRQAA